MRVDKQTLDSVKAKYGVKELWSFSKMHAYEVSPFTYYLKYIKHVKEVIKDGIYAESGSAVHDILEKFYNNEIEYQDMIRKYEAILLLFNASDLKYNKSDIEKNAAIATKYEDCIRHFFTHHQKIPGKTVTEQFVVTQIGDYVFQGYADMISVKDGQYTIYDFKTSTRYTGDKINTECQQLVLYAEALMQKGIPLSNIKCCWDFLKYTIVRYKQKNGEIKERILERNDIGNSLKTAVKTKLTATKRYTTPEIEQFIEDIILQNSLQSLPEDIRNEFEFEDCLVYVPLSEEFIATFNIELTQLLNHITDLTRQTAQLPEEEAEKLWWDSDELLKKNEYYHINLSGYSAEQHKPWGQYCKLKDNNSTESSVKHIFEQTTCNYVPASTSVVDEVSENELLQLLNSL